MTGGGGGGVGVRQRGLNSCPRRLKEVLRRQAPWVTDTNFDWGGVEGRVTYQDRAVGKISSAEPPYGATSPTEPTSTHPLHPCPQSRGFCYVHIPCSPDLLPPDGWLWETEPARVPSPLEED